MALQRLLQCRKGGLRACQIAGFERARKLRVVLLNLLGRSLCGGLNVTLQLRKRALRLRQITGLKILAERCKIVLDRARRIRRAWIRLHQLLKIGVCGLRIGEIAGLQVARQLGIILLSHLLGVSGCGLPAGLEITLQLGERALCLAKIARLQRLTQRGEIALERVRSVRSRRAPTPSEHLLNVRLGRLRARQIARLKRTGELLEILLDLLERILPLLLRQVSNQVG